MNSQDLHNLQEAYMDVYQLDEKIATPPSWWNARRRLDPEKRRLRRSRDFYTYGGENQDPDERTISTSKGEGGITKNPKKLRKQKAMGEIGESYDLYDIILSHLLDEGYADTQQAAEAIMANMSEEWREDIMEGMSMKDFKENRKKLQRKEASADARKRGHEGKTWADSGKTYSPDQAKRNRANMTDATRQKLYRVANNPDDDGGDDHYPASKTNDPKKLRKQKAMGEHG
jgi:hypothetical protein